LVKKQNWENVPKWPQTYQIVIKYTKVAIKITNDHEVHQHFQSQGLHQDFPKLAFWSENVPSGNPARLWRHFFFVAAAGGKKRFFSAKYFFSLSLFGAPQIRENRTNGKKSAMTAALKII
jgi:hypothetical protein